MMHNVGFVSFLTLNTGCPALSEASLAESQRLRPTRPRSKTANPNYCFLDSDV